LLERMHTCIPAGPCGVPFVRIKVIMSKRIVDLAVLDSHHTVIGLHWSQKLSLWPSLKLLRNYLPALMNILQKKEWDDRIFSVVIFCGVSLLQSSTLPMCCNDILYLCRFSLFLNGVWDAHDHFVSSFQIHP
jgi:hypothetical protein